jgi:hypothetical protein
MPALLDWQRSGGNINGYRGERIDIGSVLKDCLGTGLKHGWIYDEIAVEGQPPLHALRRTGAGNAPRVYVSTGIHGDEPAGPLAIGLLLRENSWPAGLDYWLCPCLNPAGFIHNCRENPRGLDLNRQYRHPIAAETKAHIAWLEKQPSFGLALCIHEDWESIGFYVYELNPDCRPSLAESIVEAAGKVCPIDSSEVIEGRPARNGIIRPNLDPCSRPDWPEAFYLITQKTRLSYTLEAPSDFGLKTRVDALSQAILAALASFSRG